MIIKFYIYVHRFLLARDLRAAGFGKNRVNMSFEHPDRTAGVNQFGPGQLEDEHFREYRLAPKASKAQDPLPGGSFFDDLNTRDLLLQVKLQKRSRAEKMRMFHTIHKKGLIFPQPGERIKVKETRELLKVRGLETQTERALVVRALMPRSEGGSTAALLCRVV